MELMTLLIPATIAAAVPCSRGGAPTNSLPRRMKTTSTSCAWWLLLVALVACGGKLQAQNFTQVENSLSGSGEAAVADVNRDGFLDVIRNDRWYENLGGTNLTTTSGWSIDNPISGALAITDLDND